MSLPANRDSSAKSLSAYYTPATLADALAQWLVRTGTERILEPSVGEGALIDAACRQAQRVHEYPSVRFTVCDINPAVIEAIGSRLSARSEARSIDFLQLDSASTGLFDGILANPPFTRNHTLDAPRRSVLRKRFDTVGAAGLWVHFLFHAMEFLRPGGRLASVIPASALFSDYGRAALQRLCGRFAQVQIREIVDRPLWVNGADERGALFLADGFDQGSSHLPESTRWSADGIPAGLLPISAAAYGQLADQCTPLGSIALLSIGAVTGCNSVFLINEEQRKTLKIRKSDLQPMVSRAWHIPGLTIDKAKLLQLAREGEKTWLLAPKSLGNKGSGVRRQLAKISARRRLTTLWFKKRTPWWKVDVGKSSDAIFTYMNDRGPRLVLAATDIRCTNTLHCVRFSDHVSVDQRLTACLSLISTFGQLAAERLGRIYGGGLLKFELKDARKFPILPVRRNLHSEFDNANKALNAGEIAKATRIADEALLAPLLGMQWEQTIEQLRSEIDARREVRRGRR
ncbi:Eco57I restriction-modification methylase domain-containing protein [Mesorhizobium dulcispinae]|uniref:Eco57I restriction-modification methylase domain-containing protein n=1 Tax=Mesorhizobium dulcispinae TaxID=3072316 RepID=UPI002A249A46|nr:N-6 DNA methylase [Mesorhizobium sp. VK23D]MDX8520911.1 N-6 DNA methylase [Mesorhizobium sp. VK23D]